MTIAKADFPFMEIWSSDTMELCVVAGKRYYIREPADMGCDYYEATVDAMRRHIRETMWLTAEEIDSLDSKARKQGRKGVKEALGSKSLSEQEMIDLQAKTITIGSIVDKRLRTIESRQRVHYAGRLAGYRSGVHDQPGGKRYLCIEQPRLIEPKEGEWPTIRALLECMFTGHDADEDAVDQLPYYMGWLAHGTKSLYGHVPNTGLGVVEAGNRGVGKTLFNSEILGRMWPGIGHPFSSLYEGDRFNAELAQCPLWVVDDRVSDSSARARDDFGKRIKAVVATPEYDFRGMHRERIVLRTFRRLVIACNIEPAALAILPQMDDDIADKLSLFKIYDGLKTNPPMPIETQEEKSAFLHQLIDEIPHFVHHLLEEYRLPGELNGRFGVAHYHHPEIMEHLYAFSPEARFCNQIDRVLWPRMSAWTGSAEDLLGELESEDSCLTRSEKRHLPHGAYAGRELAKLARRYPDRFIPSRQGGTGRHLWTIHAPSEPSQAESVKAVKVE